MNIMEKLRLIKFNQQQLTQAAKAVNLLTDLDKNQFKNYLKEYKYVTTPFEEKLLLRFAYSKHALDVETHTISMYQYLLTGGCWLEKRPSSFQI
ncbi:hypothetical protein [Lactococcus lactis]|uniref:hypothetical protein n=1 Tax=Lactococcus lactis TaxID=1358 RepID=UPI00223A9CED|nr:hypothetical protein [Lactococcus lactis]MCT1181168.1 hypothetical protein [Lactococcus lactis]